MILMSIPVSTLPSFSICLSSQESQAEVFKIHTTFLSKIIQLSASVRKNRITHFKFILCKVWEFLLWHNGLMVQLVSGSVQVPSLAWHSGLRIQLCHSCGLDLIPGTSYATGREILCKKNCIFQITRNEGFCSLWIGNKYKVVKKMTELGKGRDHREKYSLRGSLRFT